MPLPRTLLAPHTLRVPPHGCIAIIGMAASGKSTIGSMLAQLLGFAHLDTDHLIEAIYGVPLQRLADSMSKEEFLDLEAAVICRLVVSDTVISTGGSAVYRDVTMQHLATLGPLVHIHVPLPIIEKRIARKPDRGLAIAPGQSIEDLFLEREALYQKFASITVNGGDGAAIGYASHIATWARGGA